MAILRIELLEDCDMNSGRVLNTYFAEDVFYDSFGFPYIPAWVIRNSLLRVLKKSDIELSDEDMDILLDENGSFILDDALIADRESMRQAIVDDKFDSIITNNPQIVLGVSGFTDVKAISDSNGDAYIRMLSKGTIFESYFEIPEQCLHILENIVKHANALYVGHEVRTRFTLDKSWDRPRYITEEPIGVPDGEICRMEYDLHLISRVVTANHIEKILYTRSFITGEEICDSLMRKEELNEVLADNDNIRCSYAYIDVSGKRGLPIPASFATKKQNKNDVCDLCSQGRRRDDYDQIKGMGSLYIDDSDGIKFNSVSVRKEQGILQYFKDGQIKHESYTAIAEGQTFKGFIEGPAKDIRRIFESIEKNGYVRVGDLSGFGFGNCFIEARSLKALKQHDPCFANEITVLLTSPTRLYKDGYYEASAENVLSEIKRKLKDADDLMITKNSQKTAFIANYNKAWGEMEPIEYAVESGSIYRMKMRDGRSFDISPLLGGIFIGGHNNLGYGEAWIAPAKDIYYRHIRYGEFLEKDFTLSYKVDPNPGRRLMRKLYQKNADAVVEYLGHSQAKAFVEKCMHSESFEHVRSELNDDFDVEEVFETYIDSLKESCLNVIRRKYHE